MKITPSLLRTSLRRTLLPAFTAALLLSARPSGTAAPSNDNVANATVIPSGTSFSINGSNAGATNEAFENAPDYPFSFLYTIWYSWTPAVSGFLNLGGSRTDGNPIILAVFRGGAQPSAKTYLTLNDYENFAAITNLHVDAGQPYYFVTGQPFGNGSTLTVTGRVTPEPAFFNGETSLDTDVYSLTFPNGNTFGYYGYLSDAHFIYHFDLGYEYVFDSGDGSGGVYLYDFASNTFFYTSPTFAFPYLYDFTLKAFLYYYPDTTNAGHYTSKPRYFYNFATSEIITK